ncbi:MAG TPA: SDR family oxidoreductase [Candidatus Saccharimonadales bacterium]|jgi:nucleoside-diphosphate-sugar epimerase|nr:SDR family oxidoreductase [Candidatus Saccharimonadales bacterium]
MAVYLVTGAAGFIGSSLVRALLARGESVRALDNFDAGKRENLEGAFGRTEFEEMDILEFDRLSRFCQGVDYVLHHAAIASVPLSVAEPARTHDVNLTGSLNVLRAACDAGVKRVVFAASSAAYGETEIQPMQETMLPAPVSPYGVQKVAGELYMKCFTQAYGLETVCLRYFNIFGPHQDPGSPYSGVIAKFITQMLAGESPTVFGDGGQSRDFTYVENVVQANLAAAVRPARDVAGQCFNIGTGRNITLNHLFHTLCEIIHFDGELKYAPLRAGDVRQSLADISRARQALQYVPDVDFEEGLKRTVAWYRGRAATASPALVNAGH